MRYSYIYEARMSPVLNGSSAIRRFEGNDAIEIRDGITFNLYTGLPHICIAYCDSLTYQNTLGPKSVWISEIISKTILFVYKAEYFPFNAQQNGTNIVVLRVRISEHLDN